MYVSENLLVGLVSEQGIAHHLVVFTTHDRLKSGITKKDESLLDYLAQHISQPGVLASLKRKRNTARWKNLVLQSFIAQGMTEAEQKVIVKSGTINPKTMDQGSIRLVIAPEETPIPDILSVAKSAGLNRYGNIAVYPIFPSSTFFEELLNRLQK